MVKFLGIIFGFLLFGLFAIAILSGGLRIAQTNNAPQSIGDDQDIIAYSAALNQTLEGAHDDATSADSAINESPVTLTAGIPVFDAIFGIWKIIKTVPVTIYNLTVGLIFERILGDQSYGIVIGVISAILIMAIIYSVYRLVTTGESGG